jgi:flagellar protein FlaG
MEVGKVSEAIKLAESPGSRREVPAQPRPAPQAAAPLPSPVAKGLDPVLVERALAKVNRMLAERATGIRFEVSKAGRGLVVSVVDTETMQILRQMPSEEALRINEFIDRVQGIALDSVA